MMVCPLSPHFLLFLSQKALKPLPMSSIASWTLAHFDALLMPYTPKPLNPNTPKRPKPRTLKLRGFGAHGDRIRGSGRLALGLGDLWVSGFRVSGFRVSGFRVSGFRVEGFGVRV